MCDLPFVLSVIKISVDARRDSFCNFIPHDLPLTSAEATPMAVATATSIRAMIIRDSNPGQFFISNIPQIGLLRD